jgi:hypothetical protein
MSGLFGLDRLLQPIAKVQDWFTGVRCWDAVAHEIENAGDEERRRILKQLRQRKGSIRPSASAARE